MNYEREPRDTELEIRWKQPLPLQITNTGRGQTEKRKRRRQRTQHVKKVVSRRNVKARWSIRSGTSTNTHSGFSKRFLNENLNENNKGFSSH